MDERQNLDEEIVAAKRTQHTKAVKVPKPTERRSERLQDLYAAALEISDPLRASICSATADLLEIGSLVSAAIKANLSDQTSDLHGIEDAMPAINILTLVHRQTTRYVQLDKDWASEQDSGQGAKHRRQIRDDHVGEIES